MRHPSTHFRQAVLFGRLRVLRNRFTQGGRSSNRIKAEAPLNPRAASELRATALRRDGCCRRRATETVECILKAERCIDRPRDDLINILVDELVNLGDRGSRHVDDVVLS